MPWIARDVVRVADRRLVGSPVLLRARLRRPLVGCRMLGRPMLLRGPLLCAVLRNLRSFGPGCVRLRFPGLCLRARRRPLRRRCRRLTVFDRRHLLRRPMRHGFGRAR